jgi:murein tripeptide amidase MpaA
VYSDAHDAGSLDGVGLKQCVRLTGLHNLFRRELKQNWHKLSDTAGEWLQESLLEEIEEQSLRTERSTEDKDCVLGGKCDGKEDHWFTEYHDLPEIYSWFEDLAAAHPQYLTVNSSIGKTYHNTDIMAVHFTDKSDSQRKIQVYFQCLLHAREWISGPICMYIARHFANPDPETKELLKQIEFIVVPVANPDGYHLTWREYPKYRLWRKNTAPTTNPDCDGVDLNRNFDAHWSLVGSSDDPCSILYHGREPGSELEVQAITSYILSVAPVSASIDFHSYSQAILFPPAWTDQDPSNTASMEYISGWMAYHASQAGVRYGSQSMHSLYFAAGTFPDWMLEQGGGEGDSHCSPVAFTVELRPQDTPDGGSVGFMVPTEQILATCEEMMPAVMKFSHLVVDEFLSCADSRM